ncbi:MAG: TIGR04222 domain-containing membrane protein, partial [Planctomycetota bacterium]
NRAEAVSEALALPERVFPFAGLAIGWEAEPRAPISPRLGSAAALLAIGALPNPFDLSGPEFLLLYLVLLTAAVTVSLGVRARARGESPAVDLDTIDAETAAVLAHGETGAGRAALAKLLFQGTLDVEGQRVRVARPAGPEATRVERAILDRAAEADLVSVDDALEASAGAAADLRARMEVRGLLETDETFVPARRVSVALFLALLGFGAVRVAVGLQRERPVLLLVALMAAAAIALFALSGRPFRTQVGDQALAGLRRRVPRPRRGRVADEVVADTASTAVGLWGGTAVADERLGSIAAKLDPPRRDPGSSAALWGGCSSDGGGGGCGGGGCGGCGG